MKLKQILIILSMWILIFSGIVQISFSSTDEIPDKYSSPEKMYKTIKAGFEAVKDYIAVFCKQELIGEKLLPLEIIELKYKKPGDLYMKWTDRHKKGQEVIYRPMLDNKNMLAHKGGFFSFLKATLPCRGKNAMKDNHHPVSEAGLAAITSNVLKSIKKIEYNSEVKTRFKGFKKIGKFKTCVFETEFPGKNFSQTYFTQKGETVWDVAAKFKSDMYLILSRNGINSPLSLPEGTRLIIPGYYCKKSIIYIDTATDLIVKNEIYRWDGKLYESYYCNDIQLNVGLSENDFDPDNPEYKF